MQVTAKVEKFGVGYSGNIVVRSVATGGLIGFRTRFGTDRAFTPTAKAVVDGNAFLETQSTEEVSVEAEDGSVSVLVSAAGVVSTGPLPATADGVTLGTGWTGDVYAAIANELTILRGTLTAGASAGSTILHIPASRAPLTNNKAILILNDVIVGVNSNTTGYLRLASEPTEADVIEFPGTVI